MRKRSESFAFRMKYLPSPLDVSKAVLDVMYGGVLMICPEAKRRVARYILAGTRSVKINKEIKCL